MRKLRKLGLVLLSCIAIYACSIQDETLNLDGLDDPTLTSLKQEIEGRYIVVFNTDKTGRATSRVGNDFQLTTEYVREQALSVLDANGVSPESVDQIYSQVLDGFVAKLSNEELLKLRNDERISYIEPDGIVTKYSGTQTNATWGLDRVDQRALPLNQTYTYDATGTGVTAYIIDTGIRTAHVDFGGRAQRGFDAFGGNSEDCNGHGTHVAGTVGGTTYGVAKNVTLVGVRVLDCNGSGSFSGIIAGMDWVVANASGPSVANMSLGGGSSTAVNDAVQRMYDAGVPVIVAAGNGNIAGRAQDACNYSPAGAPRAYTVGATTTSDAKTSWSNYGNCVNIFAPGASITSAWHTSNTAINTISGTSMASPHVAGAAALYLQNNPGASSQQVYDFLTANSTKNIVTNSSTANNHMLYTLGNGGNGGGGDDGGGDDGGGDDGGGDDGGGGDPDPSGISLSVNGYKVQGLQRADLTWSGATSTSVDIYRNGTKIATVSNSGSYTDNINVRGGGTYRYSVCEAGTSTCSAEVTVTF
ncbi:MAG TPA: S8 family serine peptidase [Cyclobacteriaceae bacterium]|nr:S8 family serine peptidase [Cyclobacteriaceae bacterium]